MTKTPKITERDMLDLLAARYTQLSDGQIADRWVRAEHVPSKLGTGYRRIADFIAADKWPGIPYGTKMALHGHEVKVSRSDWLSELKEPEKADAFKRYMHFWWLVVSDKAVAKPEELPEGWGLMVKAGGRLRVVVPAARLDPAPLPLDIQISFAAAAARTASRAPLRADAKDAFLYSKADDELYPVRRNKVCSACGQPAPCPLHQPRTTAAAARIQETL